MREPLQRPSRHHTKATPVAIREWRDLTRSRPQPCNGLSMMASRCCPRTKFTAVIPSNERSLSSGTFIGPGEGAAPGAGCGNPVAMAVWNATLPSTFCICEPPCRPPARGSRCAESQSPRLHTTPCRARHFPTCVAVMLRDPQMIGALLAASVTDRRNGNGSDTYASGLGPPPVPRTITVP